MSEKIIKHIEVIIKEITPDAKKTSSGKKTSGCSKQINEIHFADCSFDEFISAVRDGRYESVFKVGDKRDIVLKNGETVTIAIAGIKHDSTKNGEVLPITLSFVDCLAQEHRMNEDWTNRGGWKACEMRKYMEKIFNDLLPDEWKNVIVPVWKSDTQTEDAVFLLSEYEVFGKNIYSKPHEGEKQYEFYKNKYNRIKFSTKSDYSWWYWLRSPTSGSSKGFCFVNSSGNANYDYASYRAGVAPCFAIK